MPVPLADPDPLPLAEPLAEHPTIALNTAAATAVRRCLLATIVTPFTLKITALVGLFPWRPVSQNFCSRIALIPLNRKPGHANAAIARTPFRITWRLGRQRMRLTAEVHCDNHAVVQSV